MASPVKPIRCKIPLFPAFGRKMLRSDAPIAGGAEMIRAGLFCRGFGFLSVAGHFPLASLLPFRRQIGHPGP
jgi:hypothetical protein